MRQRGREPPCELRVVDVSFALNDFLLRRSRFLVLRLSEPQDLQCL